MANAPLPNPAGDITSRLRNLLGRLGDNLIERDTPLRLAILAALSGEHLLLVGPPGTAKSALSRRMRLAFTEGAYFERLLTKFTVPEELFGPLSIKGLEDDRYERLTEGYLPDASVAFLDEIFKANSAILNALLTLLNERQFDNGARRVDVPLIAVVGASNELPEGEELNALFDRFLFRCHVAPVSSDSFPKLLELPLGEPKPEPEFRFTADELRQIQQDAEEISLPDNVRHLLQELRVRCQTENIAVSDRRWRKIVTMLKVSAHSNGREAVSIWDAWLVQHCIWEKPEQREKVHGWYEERVGVGQKPDDNGGLNFMIAKMEEQLKRDKAGVRAKDEKGRPLFVSKSTGESTLDKEEHLKRDGKVVCRAPRGYRFGRDAQGNEVQLSETNNGKGYTQHEIEGLNNQYGETYEQRNHTDRYVQDQQNWLLVKNPSLMGAKQHKPVYVESRAKDVGDALDAVQKHRGFLSKQKQGLESQVRDHLWVPDGFAGPAAVALDGALADADKLLERVGKLREGFASLPLEKEITAEDLEEEPEENSDQSDEESDDSEQSGDS